MRTHYKRTTLNQLIGNLSEADACEYLCSQGLILLERNYRCFHGEIDLIMQDNDLIVFVEVRLRHRIDYGNALESVNSNKRTKILKTAHHFLVNRKWLYKVNCRFDIVAIHPVNKRMKLEWFQRAFHDTWQ